MPQKPQDELEASLTALLLGELPHEQAAALHQKLAQDAELAKLYERLKQTINLVRETITSPAAQTADLPTPLKLSDQRRQKLLQQFKMVAPKQFAPPRRRGMPWLIPVGIAAGLVVILSGLLLPALSKAKSRGQSLGFRTFSMSDEAKFAMSAAPAPDTDPSASGERRLPSRRPSQSATFQAVPGQTAPVTTPAAAASEPPPLPSAASPIIVLPLSGELADATTTATITADANSWSASAANRGFYDDSFGRAGGVGGRSAFGGFKSGVPGDAPPAGHSGTVEQLRETATPAAVPPPVATAPADNLEVAQAPRQVIDVQPPEVNVKAKFAETKQDDQKALGYDWYLANELMNKGAIKGQAGTAPSEQTGKSAGAFDFGVAAPGTESQNSRFYLKGGAQPSVADSGGDKVPMLGDVPAAGRLFWSTSGAAGGSVNADIVPLTAPQIATWSGVESGVAATTNMAVPGQQSKEPYSLNVVGYYNVPITGTNSVAVARAEPSTVEKYTRSRQLSQPGTDSDEVSRLARSSIVLPPTAETSLALKNGSSKDVQLFAAAKQPEDAAKTQTYFEAKRQLEELQRFRQILDAKIAYEKIDVELPKTTRVELVDKAVPASSASSTLWDKIRGKPGDYKSTARIKVERDQSDISGMAEGRDMASYDPYFVQTESEAIQSEAVLGKVAEDLNLKEAWAGKKGAADKLTTVEAVQLLKKSLDLRPVPNTSLLEIGVKSDKPEEAARIANAVAEAYKANRLEQRKQLSMNGIKGLEERFTEQEEKVKKARQHVDDLRANLNISDASASGDGPSPLMSADTLRRLEGLRIENKAEYVRQVTLLDRLKSLGSERGPEALAQALPTAAPDPLLSSLLKQLTVAEQNRVTLEKEHGPADSEALKCKAVAEDLHTKIKSRVDGIMLGLDARVLSLSNSLGNLEKEVATATQLDIDRANQNRKTDVAPLKPAAPAPIPQPEVQTADNAFSTFSLNVSDVSFKLAAASLEKGVMPEAATVRSEEFINAFDYRDPEAPPGVPVAFAWERAQYPFAQNRDLLRFSIKTAAQGRQPGRPLNLVLLLDNSGSMERADRVRIIHEALRVLASQLQPQDKFSVVTFARTPRLFADGAPGSDAAAVARALTELTPQGGTNLEDAMNLAYQTALRHYLANGINRVVLLTDGAANLGNVDPEALKQKVEAHRKQGVALDCFGIGWEGYNDDLLEVLSRNGDGRYAFLNTPEEVADEFAAKLAGALQVAASDVKVQVEFNPSRVTAYRQIGYAKHQLTKEQFRDNTVNAAQIGAAEAGNALYTVEVNPSGTGPLGTVRVRFRIPGTADYREHAWDVPFTGNAVALEQASPAMRLAATSSALSEWLASTPYAGEVTPDRLLGYLSGVPEVYGADVRPKKLEWMIRQAKSIAGK